MDIESLNVFYQDGAIYAFYNDTELGVVSVYQTLPGETTLTCVGDTMAGWPVSVPQTVCNAIEASIDQAKEDHAARLPVDIMSGWSRP